LITSVKDLIDPLTAKIEAMQTDLSLMRTETAENKRLLVELLAHVDTLGTTVHSSSRRGKAKRMIRIRIYRIRWHPHITPLLSHTIRGFPQPKCARENATPRKNACKRALFFSRPSP
jgi:hypothetical protein